MILKLRIGHIRITFTIARIVDVIGVNSKLPDGNHILMWDFDNIQLKDVIYALTEVQQANYLPRIFILKTSEPDNYIAYCFQRCSWEYARALIAATRYIDGNYYKWGVFRKRFTLRVGAKLGVIPRCVYVLHSHIMETASIEELRSWVRYETLDMHHSQHIIRIGEI